MTTSCHSTDVETLIDKVRANVDGEHSPKTFEISSLLSILKESLGDLTMYTSDHETLRIDPSELRFTCE